MGGIVTRKPDGDRKPWHCAWNQGTGPVGGRRESLEAALGSFLLLQGGQAVGRVPGTPHLTTCARPRLAAPLVSLHGRLLVETDPLTSLSGACPGGCSGARDPALGAQSQDCHTKGTFVRPDLPNLPPIVTTEEGGTRRVLDCRWLGPELGAWGHMEPGVMSSTWPSSGSRLLSKPG